MSGVGQWLDRLGLRSRWAFVSLVTVIYWLGPQSVRLFYPLELKHLGASDLVIGLAAGASSVAGLVLAVPSGYLLDRFDAQRVLAVATFGLALTTGGFVLVSSIGWMILLMFLQGFFQMWVWLVLQQMMTRVGTGPQASRQLALFSLAWGIGLAAGPSVGAWIYDAWGFQTLNISCLLFTMCGVVGALLTPATLRQREAPRARPAEQPGMFGALRRSFDDSVVVGVMVSTFVNIFVQSLRTSFYSLFLQRIGLPLGTIGLLLSIIGVSSLVVRFFLPSVIRRFGLVKPLIWSTWIAIVGVAMTPFCSNIGFLAVGAVMMGAGLGANPPITINLLAEADSADRGVAVGLRMVANRSAQVLQPIVYGNIATLIGLGVAFPISGVLLGATAVWMGRRLSTLENGA
ncbi:MFS transporter [Mycobacterium sp. NPDC003449]